MDHEFNISVTYLL